MRDALYRGGDALLGALLRRDQGAPAHSRFDRIGRYSPLRHVRAARRGIEAYIGEFS